jgi:hypothetical protein
MNQSVMIDRMLPHSASCPEGLLSIAGFGAIHPECRNLTRREAAPILQLWQCGECSEAGRVISLTAPAERLHEKGCDLQRQA